MQLNGQAMRQQLEDHLKRIMAQIEQNGEKEPVGKAKSMTPLYRLAK